VNPVAGAQLSVSQSEIAAAIDHGDETPIIHVM